MNTNDTTLKDAAAKATSGSVWTRQRLERLFDIIATVLLSIGALATSWAGYQSVRWGGVQAGKYSEASQLRVESTRTSTIAGQQQVIDVGLFTSWLNAYAVSNTDLVTFYRQRFRPEFKPAFENWIATRPKLNPNAPASPFVLPEYRLELNEKAARLDAESVKAFKEAETANELGDKYVLQTVILAAVLFFTGFSQQMKWLPGRAILLGAALLMLVFSLYRIMSYPVE